MLKLYILTIRWIDTFDQNIDQYSTSKTCFFHSVLMDLFARASDLRTRWKQSPYVSSEVKKTPRPQSIRGLPSHEKASGQYFHRRTAKTTVQHDPRNRPNLLFSRLSHQAERVYKFAYHMDHDVPLVLFRCSSWQRAPTLRESWQMKAPHEYASPGPIWAARETWPAKQQRMPTRIMRDVFRATRGECAHSAGATRAAATMMPILSVSRAANTPNSYGLGDGCTSTNVSSQPMLLQRGSRAMLYVHSVYACHSMLA